MTVRFWNVALQFDRHNAQENKKQWLGVGFKHFLFLPLPGEIIQFD